MIALKRSLEPLAAIGVVAVLAGCMGSGSPPTQTAATLPMGAPAPASISFDLKCASKGELSLKPCLLTLSAKKPTAKVKAHGPKHGTITFDDANCASKGVATVSGSGSTYEVTAGASKGFCITRFEEKSGKKLAGKASLKITNKG